MFFSLLFASVLGGFIKVNPENRFLVDKNSRSMLFHGVNVVYKVDPYYPEYTHFNSNTSLSIDDVVDLKKWGFNSVRLYVAWQGLEIEKGKYDDEYIKNLKKIVEMLAENDIFVILDCHQDVGSRQYCGEGFPEHYVVNNTELPFPFPLPVKIRKDEHGLPLIKDCLQVNFAEYYLTHAASSTWQEFYEEGEFKDAFVAFWRKVASEFSSYENVLGYELLNEPWFGNIFKYPELLIPGKTDEKYLVPLYERLSKEISTVDDQHMIFFEPVVMDIGLSGFQKCIIDDPSRCVYAYHVYCGISTGKGEPKIRELCEVLDDSFLEVKLQDAKRIGAGSFLTEFGADSNSTESIDELHWMLKEIDKRFQSWTYWQYKYYNDFTTADHPASTEGFYTPSGELKLAKVKVLSRTYAQATCGVPQSVSFDPATSEYRYGYTFQNCNGMPTVVYLNEEMYYAGGFEVAVNPGSVKYERKVANYLEFSHEGVEQGQDVLIVITRKS